MIALLAAGLAVADGSHKLSKDLEALKDGHAGSTVDVIIQFNQTPTAAHHQRVQNKGGVLKRTLNIINGAHYAIPATALDALDGHLARKKQMARGLQPELCARRHLDRGRLWSRHACCRDHLFQRNRFAEGSLPGRLPWHSARS